MDIQSTNLILFAGVAFVAGLLSCISPCVLPLLPAYVTYLGGTVTTEADQTGRVQWRLLQHATLFILGFSLVFVVMGAGMGAMGQILRTHLDVVRKVGGVVVVLLGLSLLGVFTGPWSFLEKRFDMRPSPGMSGARSLLFGLVFAAGWTPCVGPILGAILTATVAQDSVSVRTGALLLAAYSLGLGVPFWLLALGIGSREGLLRGLRRHMRAVSVLSGLFVVSMGVLIYLNTFTVLAGYASRLPFNGFETWLLNLQK